MTLFGALVALYGVAAYFLYSSGYRLVGGDAERTMQIVGSVALTSLLLHFYVDSFIWKVRSKEVRAALAIRADEASAPGSPPAISAAIRRPQLRQAIHAVGLGVVEKWRGDLPDAIPLFRKAAALDPNYRDAWCDLAGALATLGQTGEALAILDRYRDRHPEDRVAADLEAAIRRDATTGP